MFNDYKEIRRHNYNRWSIIALYILLMEKKNTFKLPWKILRFILQMLMCSEYYASSFTEDSIRTLKLPHPFGLIINRHAKIGLNCTIFHDVTIGLVEEKGKVAPILGNNVYIGCKATVLGGVKLYDNVKIGAMSIVLKDVTKGTVTGIWK